MIKIKGSMFKIRIEAIRAQEILGVGLSMLETSRMAKVVAF